MKKSLKTILIVAAAMLAAGVLLIGGALLMGARPWQISLPSWVHIGTSYGTDYRSWNNSWSPDGSYAVDASGLSSIDLKWISGNVSVSVSGTNKVSFSETGVSDASQALRWGVEDGVLYIQYCANGKSTQLPEKDLTLYIPKNLASSLSAFSFDSGSADLAISDIGAESFIFDDASGALSAKSIKAAYVSLSSSSGELRFSGNYGELEADSASGKVTVDSLGSAKSTDISTASGNISISGVCGELQLDTSSGVIDSHGYVTADELCTSGASGSLSLYGAFASVEIDNVSGEISLTSEICPEELSIESSSGPVTLTLPDSSSFALIYDTASGEITSDLSLAIRGGGYVCDSGEADFRVSTSSGDLSIWKI